MALYTYTMAAADAGQLGYEIVNAALPLAIGGVSGPTAAGMVAVTTSRTLTPAEKTTLDGLMSAHVPWTATQRSRVLAVALLTDPQPAQKAFRAAVVLLVSELNLLRQRLADQDAAVAAATSLAELKSRWAALASADPMPQRTNAQAFNALPGGINSGAAD